LYALQTISQVMATSINLDDLLRLIVDKLVEAIDAERGTLYLIDPVRRELYSKILMEDGSKIREIRVAIGQGVAGHVAATGEVVNIQNAYADQRFIRAFDLTSGFITRSILAAPLRNPNGEIIGVVQVLNKGGGPFAERDERMLLAMAAQAAISIENARLHEQAMHQQLLNQELQTAKAIQQSFLPSRIPQHPDWEIDAYWTPARDVAGDFYDFQQLDDGRWAFVVADVSGKSIPAALFMALAATVIRFALALDFPPAELLQNTNRSLCAYNQQSQMFASIFVAYLDFATGRAECSSAGHNPPLLYRAASGQCEFIKIPGVIAGMFDDLSFNTSTIDLALDDVLVLYTDGITEAMTTRDEEFTEARLSALVAANAHRPARDILRVIIDAVAAHSGPRGAFDDETLVIIKRVHVTRE
jgi:sigma-B regulation protein RsbU (phosphoserine phosphatase)